MKKVFLLVLISYFVHSSLLSQSKFTISGYIEDAASAEKLLSGAVYDRKNGAGVVSNTYGFYSLTLPQGEVNLNVSYVGYQNQELSFILRGDTVIDFKLLPIAALQTVEISAKKQNKIEERTQMSQVTVPIEQIKKIPALFGEVDVLKALQMLPGVQAGGEGQNGLYVRGGSPDQNLILLDGVPVYNVSHLGGFFSVFNGDAIKNVTLTKGGFPSRYGGRLSSIIEIDMKEGNMKEFHGEGGIGIIASRLTLEGPIIKDKMSFMVSGRRTYIDLLARPIIKAALKNENSQNTTTSTDAVIKMFFYDLNSKINYKINDKHRLYLSAYNGKDIFGAEFTETSKQNKNNFDRADGGFNWGNITTALRWNYLINNKLFANTTITHSRYLVNIKAVSESRRDTVYENFLAKYDSGIKDWGGKTDFDYVPNPNHHIRFGFGGTYHEYNPGALTAKYQTPNINDDTLVGSQPSYSFESSAYIEDDMQLGLLKANVGLHISGFNVKNTFYKSLQPRLGLNYPLSNSIALKGSFATMRQYINLLTNERLGLPTDLWVPSTESIKPQDSWQAAIGAAKTFNDEYEFSVEAYYKKMKNVISYAEGANFLDINTDWQKRVTQGNGEAYGAEFFLQKKEGKTTGWIGYTLSWNWRQFDDINNGVRYPFKYDRRHDFKIIVTHQFSKRFTFTGAWQYGTGNSVSLATSSFKDIYGIGGNNNWYSIQDYEILSKKNGFRMPAYHRLDANFELTKKKKRYTRTWSFGVYNLYNRANPMYLQPATKTEIQPDGSYKTRNVIQQVSLFPIIPSIAYNFKF